MPTTSPARLVRRAAPPLLLVLLAGCATTGPTNSTAPPAPASPRPTASGDETFAATLDAGRPAARLVTLTLRAGGVVRLSIRRGDREDVSNGTWRVEGRDGVRVEFAAGADGRPAASPLLFHRDGNVLVAREWSVSEWADGLTLRATSAPR